MADKGIEGLIGNWQKRNIEGFYAEDKDKAAAKLLELIPASATIGISGSVTLDQLQAVKILKRRGNKVFNQYEPGISREENLSLRRLGAQADFYLTSANGISQNGEMVFLSGFGNRTAGISYAGNVIVVAGKNKIVPDRAGALKRAREVATPLNCKRLKNWDTPCYREGVCREDICLSPEFRRMCCQVLIIEAEATPDRLKVILVGEDLGF
ncbi:lactate utilization protein [Candidatus Omnitrophota bacterium]